MSHVQRQEHLLPRRIHDAPSLKPTASFASSSATFTAPSLTPGREEQTFSDTSTTARILSSSLGGYRTHTGSPTLYTPTISSGSTEPSETSHTRDLRTPDAGVQGLGIEGRSAGSALTPSAARVGLARAQDLSSSQRPWQAPTPPGSTLVYSYPSSTGSNTRPQSETMPRTSSIDSAVSSVSTSSHPPKSNLELKELNHEEIRTLIEAAGSPENLIQHILKEKNNAVAQNAQLWKLVDKQRALVLGLNKDLERLTKEKDRYKKKLKEMQGQASQPVVQSVRKESQSPVGSGTADPTTVEDKHNHASSTPESKPQERLQSSPIDPAMMPLPLHLQQPNEISQPTIKRRDTDSSAEYLEENSGKPDGLKDVQMIPVFVSAPNDSTDLSQTDPQLPQNSAPTQTPNATRQPSTMPIIQTSLGPPSLNLIEPSPLNEKPTKSFSGARKAPAPLNLKQSVLTQNARAGEPAVSTIEEGIETKDSPQLGRGRKKTREEDDRDREIAARQEQEARSLSKKEKRSKSRPEDTEPEIKESRLIPPTLPALGLPTSPRHPPAAFIDRPSPPTQSPPTLSPPTLSPPTLIPNNVRPESQESGTSAERHLMAPLRSPGLPTSPRPIGRPLGSPLPRNPRDTAGLLGGLPTSPWGVMPLSPRAPVKPIPLPPGSQLVTTTPAPHATAEVQSQQETKPTPLADARTMSPTEPPLVYRGLVSPAYPDLLLPPNALPSIEVKVASSRLRPSYGVTGDSATTKTHEDSAVFSLSIFSRSNRQELWRIEKSTVALPQLDHSLRPLCSGLPRLPERKLFNGHAPVIMDARRNSINTYFDELLDTPMDENTASIICKFLSTDTIDPRTNMGPTGDSQSLTSGVTKTTSKKSGYLTKRGKNFGGWKSRYYILEGPELRCFESPGGQHLSTIKLQNAQIGKQSQSGSPPLTPDETDENQYRHAFLVLEPKKKDSASLMRHVLCAESDTERDEWVEALLHYTDGPSGDTSVSGSVGEESRQSQENDDKGLKAVNYAHTVAGTIPVTGTMPQKSTMSPPTSQNTSSTAFTNSLNHDQTVGRSVISGPSNGAIISDAGLWGNKPVTAQAKEHKKRSMFHFRQRPSTDSTVSQPVVSESQHSRPAEHYNGPPVFGLPLAEAVEFCSPVGLNINLPAVVYRCIEYLRAKNAASEEGIFRLSGSNVVIKNLKERFNTEGDVDFLASDHYWDVHAIASLFKTYLRELPATVLTKDLLIPFLGVLELDDTASKITALNTLVHQLPSVNFSLLRTLSQYLLEVVQNSDKNKMSVRNVGIVFSPTLNIPAPVFAMFLTEFDAIFKEPAGPEEKRVELTVPRSLSPEDIRSPRHQLFSDLPTPAYHETNFPSTPSGRETNHVGSTDDVGFTPLQQSYENSRNQQMSQALTSHQPWQPFPQQPAADAAYGSLNRMMAPTNTSSAKAKRRESSMLFM